MSTKLTLTVDNDIIIKAKEYAYSNGYSLSELVENYLRSVVNTSNTVGDISPGIQSLMGSFKAPADFDYKEALDAARIRKHG